MAYLMLQAPVSFVDEHGNKGKSSVKKDNVSTYEDLRERLKFLRDNYSTPFATRVVKNEAGFLYTKNDGKVVYLPPSFSMRNKWKDCSITMDGLSSISTEPNLFARRLRIDLIGKMMTMKKFQHGQMNL